jgi:hypothetical protein
MAVSAFGNRDSDSHAAYQRLGLSFTPMEPGAADELCGLAAGLRLGVD